MKWKLAKVSNVNACTCRACNLPIGRGCVKIFIRVYAPVSWHLLACRYVVWAPLRAFWTVFPSLSKCPSLCSSNVWWSIHKTIFRVGTEHCKENVPTISSLGASLCHPVRWWSQKVGSTCLSRLTPEWVVRPCPPIGSSFIACATMYCLVRSQPFSCPLLLILQENHQGNHCSDMDCHILIFCEENQQERSKLLSPSIKEFNFQPQAEEFSIPTKQLRVSFYLFFLQSWKFRFHINEWIHSCWFMIGPKSSQ